MAKSPILTISNSGPGISLPQIEAECGPLIFPGADQFIKFYQKHNGGRPNKTTTAEPIYSTIDIFYPIASSGRPGVATIAEVTAGMEKRDRSYFGKMLIFGQDAGANLFCVERATGVIYFVPLDYGDLFAENAARLAGSFQTYLDKLQLFDTVYGD
ncbi:SMI1/KNR4 family protein [Inquilinus sp. OTU3971]|uniref:SMI1/KNR4 family protein n=1 Tax=Inquilinus sp. OTU3971 TaxID=3043855 RepID=UPI00313DF882